MKNEAEAFHVSRTRIIQTRDIFLVLLKCRLALTSMHDCALLATGACRGHSVCDGYGIQEGPLRSHGVVLPLFLALSSSSLFADQVTFRNGDRLTGSIVKSDAATLVIRTVVAGEISVSCCRAFGWKGRGGEGNHSRREARSRHGRRGSRSS